MASCVQYLSPDGFYREGIYHGTVNGIDQYRSCSWWADQSVIFPAVMAAVFLFVLWKLLKYLRPRFTGAPESKTYSKIKPESFIREKVAPPAPQEVPDVPEMSVEWGDESPTTVELYLALSQRERAIIEKWGLNEAPIEDLPVYEEVDLEKLRRAQERELERATDPQIRASLRMEHKHQLDAARSQKWARTIEYYLAYPYRQTFETRYQATQYRNKLEFKILPDIRRMLEQYGDRQ